MELSISWPAVVVATAVGMGVAMVWYSDWGLLGTRWRTLTGITKEDDAKVGKRPLAILAVSVIVTAVALAVSCSIASTFFADDSVWLALVVGLVTWLGFSFSTLVQHNAFEQKPALLTVINSAYQLILFLGMTLAIGLLQ